MLFTLQDVRKGQDTPSQGLGFRVWGLGFGVWGLGFGVWGLGFGVWGLGFGGSGINCSPTMQSPDKKHTTKDGCFGVGGGGGGGSRFWGVWVWGFRVGFGALSLQSSP